LRVRHRFLQQVAALVGRICRSDEQPCPARTTTDKDFLPRNFFVRRCPSAPASFVRYSNWYRSVTGGVMQYALLAYGGERTDSGPVDGVIADVLARPYVTGWARLHADGSATTVRHSEERTLLTDGPFIETKEFLAGVIVVEADNLDGALAIAQELQESRTSGAIEVRPILEALFHGA
jgi:hypothetical protein